MSFDPHKNPIFTDEEIEAKEAEGFVVPPKPVSESPFLIYYTS